jgi:GABA permease
MRNPMRTEAEAYRLVLLTVVAFVVIVVVTLFAGFAFGVFTWAVLTAAVAFYYLRSGRAGRPVPTAPPHRGAADERRVLVLANRVLEEGPRIVEPLIEEIQLSTAGYRARVDVVYPLPLSSVRHWVSDVDAARAEAGGALDQVVSALRAHGLDARGELGDEDPVRAVEDELRTFGADSIVIVTHDQAERHELDASAVERVRESFALPVTCLTVPAGRASVGA